MANLTITNQDVGSVKLWDGKFEDELLAFAGADTAVEGTLLGRKEVATTIAAAAAGGNTGDGVTSAAAVVAGPITPIAGVHNLECVAAGVGGVAAGTFAPDGGNTGDGLVTGYAISSGGAPKVGSFILKCTDANEGGGKTGAGVFTGTGNGAIGTITPAAEAIEGDYITTCIDATVSGSEIFNMVDPNGNVLENMTVAAAYDNAHLGFTLADGSTDFIVGDYWTITVTIAHGGKFKLTDPIGVDLLEDITLPGTTLGTIAVSAGGIDFTLNDGATDFAADDFFTLVVGATELGGGTFKLEDPNGALLAESLAMTGGAGVATVFEVAGMTFTITDGATDFIVGDSFTLTVAADSDLGYYSPDGLGGLQVPKFVLTYEVVATGAGDIAIRAMISGEVEEERLVIDDGSTITAAILDQLRGFTIISQPVEELNALDNQ